MNRSRTKKRKSKSTKDTKKVAPINLPEEEKPFDYGGLPMRDLKKNLGCG